MTPRRLITLCIALGTAALVARDAGTALVVSQPLTQPDAIVSLGSHEWERLPLAAEVARSHPNAFVLLTVPRKLNAFNCHDCAGRVGLLQHLGVAPARIRILPLAVANTYDEARSTLDFAKHNGIHHLLVVTSAYHTRRALAVFSSVFEGTNVEVGIVPALATLPAQPRRWWASPYNRWYVTYEWAAIAYYAIRHGIIAVYGVNSYAPMSYARP